MPKIADLFEYNGALCVRLEDFPPEEHGSISIYTEHEIEQLKRDIALAIIDQINKMYPKPSN